MLRVVYRKEGAWEFTRANFLDLREETEAQRHKGWGPVKRARNQPLDQPTASTSEGPDGEGGGGSVRVRKKGRVKERKEG